MKDHIQYLKYVIKHKFFVFLSCNEVNNLEIGHISFWQSIFHDFSKFFPSEWFAYVKTFYKPDGSKQYKKTPEFAKAWKLHQNRNQHHWQNWLLTWDRGETVAIPMPERYVLEMIADWIGAGMVINGKKDANGWYEKNKHNMILHPETRKFVELVLDKLIKR